MNRRYWFSHSVIGACLAFSVEAGAQELPRLEPGSPVRLVVRTVAGPRSFAGGLVLISSDSVSIVWGARPQNFSLTSIERFEINRGRPNAVMLGAPIAGAAAGALVGATALAPVRHAYEMRSEETLLSSWGRVRGKCIGLAARLLVPDVWQEIRRLLSSARARGARPHPRSDSVSDSEHPAPSALRALPGLGTLRLA
jgi:hypothetical protein